MSKIDKLMIVIVVLAVATTSYLLISAFSGEEGNPKNMPTNNQSTDDGQIEAKAWLDAADAPLSQCLMQKAKSTKPPNSPFFYDGEYSYNDWGCSDRILINLCKTEVKAWCQTTKFCDMHKEGTESVSGPGGLHVYALASDAIKKTTPKTQHNIIINAFRDCTVGVVIDGAYPAYEYYPFFYSDFLLAVKSKCIDSIEDEIHECMLENPRMDRYSCDTQVKILAMDIFRNNNLIQLDRKTPHS